MSLSKNSGTVIRFFIGFVLCPQSYLMFSDDVDEDGGHVQPTGGTGAQVKLPDHTHGYLVADCQHKGSS